MTSHKHGSWKTEVAKKFYKCSIMQIWVCTVFYDIKWLSSEAFEFEKKNNPYISIQLHKKKLVMLNVIKQLQHFILCNIIQFERDQYCCTLLHNNRLLYSVGNILYESVLYWKPVLDKTSQSSSPIRLIRVFNTIRTSTIYFHIVHNTV